jgi:hypothetical protein
MSFLPGGFTMVRFKLFGISILYWLLLSLGLVSVLGLSADFSSAAQPATKTKVAQVSSYSPRNGDEKAAIAAYLKAVAQRQPNSVPPTITKLVVSGQYALLDWVYSQMGGQAVLTKKDGEWRLIRGVGGAFNVQSLQTQGVPPDVAIQLLKR